MAAVADVLGVVRLLAAVLFPVALARALHAPDGGLVPLGLFAVAAATDFVDGPLARHSGAPSRHGAILDGGADLAFVLAASGSGAALGLVPAAVPGAIAVAFGAYVLASVGRRARGDAGPARSAVGHTAGVVNYALAGVLGAAAAWPAPAWVPVLRAASLVVVAVNLAAVVDRLVPRGGPGRDVRPTAPRART